MSNRRNYYRILHVQPEAPDEIIKASYRTLMTKLSAHPDRGGDTATAALINEAYATLRDPQKRRAYDLSLRNRSARPGIDNRRPAPSPGATSSAQQQTTRGNPSDTARPSGSGCPFCGAMASAGNATAACCPRCNSPLTAPSVAAQKRGELFGRRGATRTMKNEMVVLYPSWPHAGIGARLRDLSPDGISILSVHSPAPHQLLKISGTAIEAIARVVSVRRSNGLNSIHARLLTATFPNRGAFVSAKV